MTPAASSNRRARSGSGSSAATAAPSAAAARPGALEVGPDRRVAVAAAREQLGAALREPRVVDEPGTIERRERLLARRRSACPARASRCSSSRARPVASGQRPRRRARAPAPAKLARELPRRVAVERPPDREAGPDDRVGRHTRHGARRRARRRPGRASARATPVTIGSLTPRPSAAAQRLRRHLRLAVRRSRALPRRRPAGAARRRSAPGRAPAGSPARICCVTSGCSRRNAVAFWRPWPSRSSPKLKYEPDFVTTFRSMPESSTVPSQEMPEP